MPVQEWVPRIRLYFLSEDPALYAKRVAIAHQSRIDAVNAMRYHLCIDSMPADDMHSLSVEQINRVLTLALNSKFLRVRTFTSCMQTMFACHVSQFLPTGLCWGQLRVFVSMMLLFLKHACCMATPLLSMSAHG